MARSHIRDGTGKSYMAELERGCSCRKAVLDEATRGEGVNERRQPGSEFQEEDMLRVVSGTLRDKKTDRQIDRQMAT